MVTNKNFDLAFIKIIPIIGIAIIAISKYTNSLNIEGIFKIIMIVSAISAVLVVLEKFKESDSTSLLVGFFMMHVLWFAAYPLHFLMKEEREKKGQYSLIAAFFSFVLIIGAGEMHRFGFLNSFDEYRSEITNLILGVVLLIVSAGAPVLIANVLNSIKKSYSIIYTLISLVTLVGVNSIAVKSEIIAIGYITAFVFYILALRMSFYKPE